MLCHSCHRYAALAHQYLPSILRHCPLSSNVLGDPPKPAPAAVQAAPKGVSAGKDVKVVPSKPKKRQPIDYSAAYFDNIFIEPQRAMLDFCLDADQLSTIRSYTQRSPYSSKQSLKVFLLSDVQKKALDVHGSPENLAQEQRKLELLRRKLRMQYRSTDEIVEHYLKRQRAKNTDAMKNLHLEHIAERYTTESIYHTFTKGSGRVVLWAVAMNGANFIFKGAACIYTGSHSMFAETLHSAADTVNQLVLAYGLRQSVKQADQEHPYGYMNARYISSLISGMGILSVGAGSSIYRGFQALLTPSPPEPLFWATCCLVGSLLSEGFSLWVAYGEVKKKAKEAGLPLLDYVKLGENPTVNVVLFEDFAAVAGVMVATGCIGLTSLTGSPFFDTVGCIGIGGLLGAVALKILSANINALLGRSIPEDRQAKISRTLESDRMVRAVYDVKATDLGGEQAKYKAEVVFDGREVTRHYLSSQDIDSLMHEVQEFTTTDDLHSFLLHHGEGIVDVLGEQVDRIERTLKSRHPSLRHVDLEVH